MTYKLTITDDEGRIICFANIERDVTMERTNEYEAMRDRGRYHPDDYMYYHPRPYENRPVYQGRDTRNEISIRFKAIPLKDGSLIKTYRHKKVDKLPGGM